MTETDLSKSDMTEIDLSDIDKLLGIIECQLQIIVTISEMDSDLYDDLDEDRVKTMSGAFRLIREAQRKISEDVKKLGKG